jgi:hypothetical protein
VSQGIRLRRAGLILTVVAAAAIVPGEPAAAQTPDCPTDMQTASIQPAPEFTTAAVGSERAREWLRKHPMPISALVASVPNPPKSVVDAYFEPFGANAAHLWKDGPPQVEGWLQFRRGAGYITWLENNGNSVAWNGSEFVDTGQPIGGLPGNNPGRIGYQVGDEPQSVDEG